MEQLDSILIIISFSESATIIAITIYLYLVAKLQFVATLTTAFQDQWHARRAVVMRDYLHSLDFQIVFKEAIKKSFNKTINCKKIEGIDQLFEGENRNIIEKDGDLQRFKKFDSHLKNDIPPKSYIKDFSYSTFDALYEVLLSFDRIALFRNDHFMMKKCIRLYKPPIRDLSIVLQYFIAVRIILRDEDMKNYKKDYMHLLGLLSIIEPLDKKFPLNLTLFITCKEGLIGRKELSNKECNSWDEIIKKRQSIEKRANIYKKSSSYYFARY